MTIALMIGALQMSRGRGGFVTSYGADIFGTAWLYAMFRQGRTIFGRREMSVRSAALFVLGGCAASEIGQRFNIFPGTFDPWDFVAFVAAIAACSAIDRRLDLR
jgi:hypothetical protein